MANIKVKDLTDTQTINTDDEIMVLTDENTNLVQNITVENFITNIISSDSDNVIEQGADGKLFVETPENITGDLSNLTTTNKSTLVAAINEVDSDITAEAATRANADNNLQSQIDAITAASDVTDIVGTYAQLQVYDTTGLPDNSIIKVLQDESRQNETTYYRWVITGGVGAWVLIGEEGPYYTISQSDSKFATQATVGNLNNLATSDKSSVVNAMNELASVLDPTQTADYIKNSKAIYSGEVSENGLILPQIKEMARSTFDISKFTLVGSPNITNDGIVSGFSDSNYITFNTGNISFNTFEIVSPVFKNDTSTQNERYMCQGIADNLAGAFTVAVTNASIITYFYWIENGEITGVDFVTSLSTLGKSIQIKVKGNRNSIDCYVSIDNGDFTYVGTKNINFTALSLNTQIGKHGAANYYYTGSIDLKQFSITADGVEVFSGNKTGVDTIKPDDYTVVGSPTISADGIASGFDGDNYIQTSTLNINNCFDFELISPIYKFDEMISGYQNLFLSTSFADTYVETFMELQASAVIVVIRQSSNEVLRINTGWTPNINDTFQVKLKYKNNQWIVYCNINNGGWTAIGSPVSDTNGVTINNSVMKIGCESSTVYLHGKADLNTFKIYVDGDLVYQPCLKIPYTESKTGSKIVGVNYRDRVTDMAEQFGYAPYYTLSDTDFTLPQGEIYGYLEKRARDIAHPVAQPFYRFSDEINEDEVRLEGAEVDKGLYLAIENDPYLSALCTAGSTSDKICLPDFRNRVIYGDIASGYVEPELPNITGSVNGPSGTSADGAFTVNPVTQLAGGTSSFIREGGLSFNASLSSSIYKDGGTVKTAGVKARWLCRWK